MSAIGEECLTIGGEGSTSRAVRFQVMTAFGRGCIDGGFSLGR